MTPDLVLSTFPGLGLLDRAFEEEGFVVVKGPDLLWGGRIETFHAPAGRFDGVIGGPPCQAFSVLRHLNPHCGEKFGNLIPEYERCVFEAQPTWWIMENVEGAPLPVVQGYQVWSQLIRDDHVGGLQPRKRRISFGTRDGRPLDIEYVALMAPEQGEVPCEHGPAPGQRAKRAVTGGHNPVPDKGPGGAIIRRGRSLGGEGRISDKPHALPHDGSRLPMSECLRLQGLPEDFCAESPFTKEALRKMLGNGVPQALGRAVARSVRKAMEGENDAR